MLFNESFLNRGPEPRLPVLIHSFTLHQVRLNEYRHHPDQCASCRIHATSYPLAFFRFLRFQSSDAKHGGGGALIRHGGTGNEVLHVHPVMRHPSLPPRRPLEIRHWVAGGRLAAVGVGVGMKRGKWPPSIVRLIGDVSALLTELKAG